MNRTVVLACKVFSNELDALQKRGILNEHWSVRFLEMGLHNHPPLLKSTLQEEIDRLEETESPERIILAYGHCGGGLVGLKAKKAVLIIPLAHDCISILLGSAKRHQNLLKTHPRTYFSSGGWLASGKLPGGEREISLREQYSDMDEDVLEDLLEADAETFQNYNRLTHVSTEATSQNEINEAKECASSQEWELKVEKGGLNWLSDLISENWDSDRILVTEPEQDLKFPTTFFQS